MKKYNVCFIRTTSEQVSYEVFATSRTEAEAFAEEMLSADNYARWEPTDYLGDVEAAVDLIEDFSQLNNLD